MKVLMYVDAENVTEEQLKNSLNSLQDYNRSYEIKGRFYGDRQNMGNIFNICMSYGLEFVDTSVLSTRRKNIADMKIIVDAMEDVLDIYKGQVFKIILVSNDIDFLPLVYKVTGRGIQVDSFLCDNDNIPISLKDVNRNLYTSNYFPMTDNRYFSVPFVDIRRILPAQITDDLIQQFLGERYEKFITSISSMVDTKKLSQLSEINTKEISAKEITHYLKEYSVSDIAEILKNYCQKMFGSAPKKENLYAFIKEVLS